MLRFIDPNQRRHIVPLMARITEREREVLKLLTRGLSNKQIAEALVVTDNTIKTHLQHIYEKLEVSKREEAIDIARMLDLL